MSNSSRSQLRGVLDLTSNGGDQPAAGVPARTWHGVRRKPARLKAAMADILENAEAARDDGGAVR